MDLRERPAYLTGGTEEVAKRHLLALRLQVPEVVAKLPAWNVFEYQIRGVRIEVGLVQGDDVGMGTYLAQHVNLPLSRERIGSRQHNGQSDLPASLRIPGQIGLFTRAFPDQMFDAVAVGEKRAIRKRNVHSAQIVALPSGNRIPNKSVCADR